MVPIIVLCVLLVIVASLCVAAFYFSRKAKRVTAQHRQAVQQMIQEAQAAQETHPQPSEPMVSSSSGSVRPMTADERRAFDAAMQTFDATMRTFDATMDRSMRALERGLQGRFVTYTTTTPAPPAPSPASPTARRGRVDNSDLNELLAKSAKSKVPPKANPNPAPKKSRFDLMDED